MAAARSEVKQVEAKRKDETKVVAEQPSILSSTNTYGSVTQSSPKDVQERTSKEMVDAIANKPQEEVTNTRGQVQYRPKDIYEAALPFILQQLEQPKDENSLAKYLDVKVGQMRAWLKRAVKEGKVIKHKKPVTYEVNRDGALLSLLDSVE